MLNNLSRILLYTVTDKEVCKNGTKRCRLTGSGFLLMDFILIMLCDEKAFSALF